MADPGPDAVLASGSCAIMEKLMMVDKKQLGRGQFLKHKVGTCFLEAICAKAPGSRQRMQNRFSG